MSHSLLDPRLRATLDRLHADAARDKPRIAKAFLRSAGCALQSHDMADAYIAISREQGELLGSSAPPEPATSSSLGRRSASRRATSGPPRGRTAARWSRLRSSHGDPR
ncbi:MAG: hypothetical protein AAF624_03245 [Bacteroidota bacterium]